MLQLLSENADVSIAATVILRKTLDLLPKAIAEDAQNLEGQQKGPQCSRVYFLLNLVTKVRSVWVFSTLFRVSRFRPSSWWTGNGATKWTTTRCTRCSRTCSARC